MPALAFSTEAYGRPGYGLPEARLVNMYVEVGGPARNRRMPRPGMVDTGATPGVGPIRKLFAQPGAFGGGIVTASAGNLYLGEDVISGDNALSLDGPVRIAISNTQIAIVCGGQLRVYNGATVELIAHFQASSDPLPYFIDCVLLADRLVLLEANGTIWWSVIGDFTNIDPLNFATAESKPDAGVALAVRGQQLGVIGSATFEWWYPTADPDAPFQRTQNVGYDRGCPAQESVGNLDNTVVWVDDLRRVCRAGSTAERISNHGVEGRLRACTDITNVRAWTFPRDGHEFYVLNIPGQGSWAFDAAAPSPDAAWSEWQSYGRPMFRGRCAVVVDGETYVGDDASNKVWRLDESMRLDGADPITRIASASWGVSAGLQRCDTVMLQCARGVGLIAGQGSQPKVQMRYSDDAGQTWSGWDDRSLGEIGEYSRKAIWRRKGIMRSPGRAFEFRVTDPVLTVFEGATINEARP